MNFLKKYKLDCCFFDGYKPCQYKKVDCIKCPQYKPKGKLICLINLDAMGDVLMTTALLLPIKRKYPKSYIIWITEKSSMAVLNNNPLIDKVFPFDFESYLSISQIKFDLILNVDKSLRSASLAMSLKGKTKKGYGISGYGSIIPLNKEAQYAYELGLDDELKFRKNIQTGQQILTESFGFEYKQDEYVFNLDKEQIQFIKNYKKEQNIMHQDIIIGFNTGCSPLYPYKKFKKEHVISLCRSIHKDYPDIKIALFGGKNETDRNEQIKKSLSFPVLNTPTTMGLKTGIAVMDIADIILSGDTLGMHIGIGLKKRMVVWFNVSCHQEIDLYGRGEKIISHVECSPCWKRKCDSLKCLKEIELNKIHEAIKREIKKTKENKNINS